MKIYQVKNVGNLDCPQQYTTLPDKDVRSLIANRDLELEKIEGLTMLAEGKDIYEIVHKLKYRLTEVFTDLETLVTERGYLTYRELPDTVDLSLTLRTIQEKAEEAESLLNALNTITSDIPSDFGYEKKE